MSGFESISPQKSEQDTLKQKMLNGEVLPKEVFDRLLELDQSTPDRRQAFTNYETLTDERVANFIQSQSPEALAGYYKILGFTEFHLGQIKAIETSSNSEALSFFRASLEHAGLGLEDEEWISYVASTVAYFEQDIQKLDETSQSQEIVGNNRKIVENMKKGLRERGEINYREDYRVD